MLNAHGSGVITQRYKECFMRYGLSLLVCFALTAFANAQCANCPAAQAAVRVATAPVRVVNRVTNQVAQRRQVQRPVRTFFWFRR